MAGNEVTEQKSLAQIHQRSREISAALQGRGVSQGERALLLFQSPLRYCEAFFACLDSGLVAVPAPLGLGTRRDRTVPHLKAIEADCQPAVVLTDQEDLNHPRKVLAMELEAEASASAVGSVGLALLQYTSGSTRLPKGVMVSHQNLLHNLSLIRQFLDRVERPSFLHWLPLHHDMGLIRGMLSPLDLAADCYFLDPLEFISRPQRWLEGLTRFQISITGAPNFGFALATRKATKLDELDLSRLELAFCTAEPIQLSTFERFEARFASCGLKPTVLKPAYGLAEATVAVSGETRTRYRARTVDRDQLRQGTIKDAEEGTPLVCCGQVLGDQVVKIVGSDGQACGPDIVGEVWLRGPSVSKGYWGSEASPNFECWLGDDGPYLRTGDLGFLDPDGGLWLTGRKDDLIIIRGQNYRPQDLESTLEEACDWLRPGSTVAFEQGQQIGICAELGGEVDSPEQKVLAVLGEQFGLSLGVLCLTAPGALPKTPSGKRQRRRVRALCTEGKLRGVYRWERPSR